MWSSFDSSLTLLLYIAITTMESDDRTNASGQNLQVGQLMNQANDGIFIEDNVKISQHGPEFENIDQVDGEENIE